MDAKKLNRTGRARKLALNRNTVRHLNGDELQVAGAATWLCNPIARTRRYVECDTVGCSGFCWAGLR
ncbi:MAG: hypothetical protein HY698_14425 [Deltaproteobacteria bacterium]|nr:hypothetical protein [Deltaproteobacteria bacterium]